MIYYWTLHSIKVHSSWKLRLICILTFSKNKTPVMGVSVVLFPNNFITDLWKFSCGQYKCLKWGLIAVLVFFLCWFQKSCILCPQTFNRSVIESSLLHTVDGILVNGFAFIIYCCTIKALWCKSVPLCLCVFVYLCKHTNTQLQKAGGWEGWVGWGEGGSHPLII